MVALLDELGGLLLVFLDYEFVFFRADFFKQLIEILVSAVNRQPLLYGLLSLLNLIELLISLGLAIVQFEQNSFRPFILRLDIFSTCNEHQAKVIDTVNALIGGLD